MASAARQDDLAILSKADLVLIAKADADSQNLAMPMNHCLTMLLLLYDVAAGKFLMRRI